MDGSKNATTLWDERNMHDSSIDKNNDGICPPSCQSKGSSGFAKNPPTKRIRECHDAGEDASSVPIRSRVRFDLGNYLLE